MKIDDNIFFVFKLNNHYLDFLSIFTRGASHPGAA